MQRQKAVYYLAFISIFLVPLSAVVPFGPNLWYVQMIFLISMLVLGVSVSVWRFNKYLSMLNMVALYSTMITANQGLRSLFYLFIFNLSILATREISKLGERHRKTLLQAIYLLFFIQFGWLILQNFNLDPIFDKSQDIYGNTFTGKDDTVGFSGSHNQIGLFFAITAPLVFLVSPIFLIFNVIGVCLSTTSTALIALCSGCLVCSSFLSQLRRFRLIIFFLIGSNLFFMKYENIVFGALRERVALFNHSIKEIKSGNALMRNQDNKLRLVQTRKWEGFGLGNFMSISPLTQWQFMEKGDHGQWPAHRYEHMHNDYLEIFYEMGICGFIAVILLVLNFIWSFIKAKKTPMLIVSFSCIVAQLVCAMGIYTIYTAISGMLLIVFYGIYRGELNGKKTFMV